VPITAVTRQGDLFAGDLGVHVDDDDLHLAIELLQDALAGVERAIRPHVHERPPQQREHRDRLAAPRGHYGDLQPDRLRRKIRGPDDAVRRRQQRQHLAPPIDVVPHRTHVDAVVAELGEHLGGQAAAGGGVFGVGDDAVDAALADELGDDLRTGVFSGATDDVPDDQEPHAQAF
jgi:hypothetical protein